MSEKQILIIDDEEILIKTFTRLLAKKGYGSQTASNGEEAVELVRDNSFDLILSDMRMPGMNGVETIEAIRAISKEQNMPIVPVIFLTGYADKELEAKAQTLNPLAYIYKPFDAFKLLEVIEKHFA